MLEFWVRARVTVKVRAMVRNSWGTKCLGTKKLWYKMSGNQVIYPEIKLVATSE